MMNDVGGNSISCLVSPVWIVGLRVETTTRDHHNCHLAYFACSQLVRVRIHRIPVQQRVHVFTYSRISNPAFKEASNQVQGQHVIVEKAIPERRWRRRLLFSARFPKPPGVLYFRL